MFSAIKDFLGDLISDDSSEPENARVIDKKLCAAALMVHVMAADGKIQSEEEAKLLTVLETHYDLTADQARELAEDAKKAQSESIDLYAFTSILKAQMDETERMGLVEDLWEMVYADGEIHEFEDNMVWRLAELLNISSERRMRLKTIVRDRAGAKGDDFS
ncbi:TerB family tellurite resistance protein [Pseudahrensia aquimaris]|uniref:TerB family tellurite resistance protein n=1 Tax=Pseudahrensia aquimaris TaxID=744461 RepID=A0ABW3FIJ4_9HYPH